MSETPLLRLPEIMSELFSWELHIVFFFYAEKKVNKTTIQSYFTFWDLYNLYKVKDKVNNTKIQRITKK